MNDDLNAVLAERKREKPRIYKELADEQRAQTISKIVSSERQNFEKSTKLPKINLNDYEAVKRRVSDYLVGCESTSTIPSFLGLSVSLGLSRQMVYKFLQNHPESPSAQYLEVAREILADALIQAGMARTTEPAVTIFSLKNLHGFADKVEITPVSTPFNPLGEQIDQKALEETLDALPDDDFDE